MSTFTIVMIVVVVVLAIIAIALYFAGKKLQKKQDEQQAQMDAIAQVVPILVIDKKKMPVRDAGFPASVLESIPKRMRRAKAPIVKAKIGPKVVSLLCENSVYDLVPVKKEVRATISGIYITDVKGVRGPLEAPEEKKKGLFRRKK